MQPNPPKQSSNKIFDKQTNLSACEVKGKPNQQSPYILPPCILFELGANSQAGLLDKFSHFKGSSGLLKTYPTTQINEINILVCYCSEHIDKNIITEHNNPLVSMECAKGDILRLIKLLDIKLKILAPLKETRQVYLKDSKMYSYFCKMFSEDPASLVSGKWGCLNLGFGLAHFCFCKNSKSFIHGLTI